MITKEILKELCPIHIQKLSRITHEGQKEICQGWLRDYLRDGSFSFINGIIRVNEV